MSNGRFAIELVMAGWLVVGAVGCADPSAEDSGVEKMGEARRTSGLSASTKDACALLDDPSIRRRMSGGLETGLLRACGRVPTEARNQSRVSGQPSGSTPLAAAPAAITGTDVRVNNPAFDTDVNFTQSETSVAVAGNTICVAYNDIVGDPASSASFSASLDGGATFTDRGAFIPPEFLFVLGDPSLAYSVRDNAFYFASLTMPIGSGDVTIGIWRSTDQCQSFTFLTEIFSGIGDKSMMAIDNNPTSPFFGRIQVAYTELGGSTDLNRTAFSNDGMNWISNFVLPGSGEQGQGAWPAVAPNGNVYVALVNLATTLGGLQDQFMFRSQDGGNNWVKMPNIATGQHEPTDIAAGTTCGRPALNGFIRHLPSPQISISTDAAAPAGYVIHAVYPYDSDGTGPDDSNVFYRRSVDGAQTWSAEVRLNDDTTTTDQFFPALQVSPTGVAVASWYDRRLDPSGNLRFDRFAAFSTNAGLTWSVNQRVSDVSSPVADTLNGNFSPCYHGDYDQVAVAGNVGHIVWSDDRRVTSVGPNPDVYYDKLVLNVDCSGDTTPPTFTSVPADITTTVCGSFDIGTATATDPCGVTITNNAPAQFPPGTTLVTWRATDGAGNVATATQRVTLILTDNPACCPPGTNVIVGTAGNDTINGTSGSDCILGRDGQDTLNGLGGNDFISGGGGDDIINGGDGNDVLFGGLGQDQLNGGNGADTLFGDDGDDTLQGGIGDDRLNGGAGQDHLFGQDGNDLLNGDAGDDMLSGGNGNDNLVGGADNDHCDGGVGTNTFAQCEFGSPNSCADGQQDGTETGRDCGGGCPACSAGAGCISRGDCQASLLCVGGICRTPGG
jgi:hypothetical protein